MAPTTRPLPTCAAPKPFACGHCSGSAVEPDEDGVPCLACDGTGRDRSPVAFRLPRSRTYPLRAVSFDPGAARLTIAVARSRTRASEATGYDVAEFAPGRGWKGRAFELVKDGGECRRVFVGDDPAETSCDCEGGTYLSAAKANQRAHDSGGGVFPSFGCVHQDALVPLVAAGWFDRG